MGWCRVGAGPEVARRRFEPAKDDERRCGEKRQEGRGGCGGLHRSAFRIGGLLGGGSCLLTAGAAAPLWAPCGDRAPIPVARPVRRQMPHNKTTRKESTGKSNTDREKRLPCCCQSNCFWWACLATSCCQSNCCCRWASIIRWCSCALIPPVPGAPNPGECWGKPTWCGWTTGEGGIKGYPPP